MNLKNEKFSRIPFPKPTATFSIVGLGGTGGFVLECLLRAGAEKINICDIDRFELSNFNRQILAVDSSLDLLKTEVAQKRAMQINKEAEVRKIGLEEIEGIVLDCTDNKKAHNKISEICKEKSLYHIFCSAEEHSGSVWVFKKMRFEEVFKSKNVTGCSKISCSAVAVSGAVAAHYAIMLANKEQVPEAPKYFYFNLKKNHFEVSSL